MEPTGGGSLRPPFNRVVTQNGCENKNVDEDDGERTGEGETSHRNKVISLTYKYLSRPGLREVDEHSKSG